MLAWSARNLYVTCLQVAGDVDTLIDEERTAEAVPLLSAAAQRILRGEHKRRIWVSGGALLCPLEAPQDAQAGSVDLTDDRAAGAGVHDAGLGVHDADTADVQEERAPEACADQSTSACSAQATAPERVPGGSAATHAVSYSGAAAAPILGDQACHKSPAPQPVQSEADGAPTAPPPVPLFLARFDAAWIYAELATMYVSHLEKQRQYEAACSLLRALLGGSACPARRCARVIVHTALHRFACVCVVVLKVPLYAHAFACVASMDASRERQKLERAQSATAFNLLPKHVVDVQGPLVVAPRDQHGAPGRRIARPRGG